MDAIRIQRIQSVMKDELNVLINRDLKDPRIPSVTVTKVEMTRDAKQATVFISILSLDQTATDPELMEHCLDSLTRAKGHIKRTLSKAIQLRFMPELLFREDKGLENTLRVHELLKQISEEKKPT
ncbi:MAG: 30S ribosome-binding factor RbfA [Bdellovibrionales bacterium]|jgi:ribosome-binding factor A|nr:30S ribosome-binding factor RbfA [Bdellovibrionales bacterium]